MLAKLLLKTPEQRILSLFAMDPGRKFYLREISKRLGLSLGATHAALLILEKAQILSSSRLGKIKLLELDEQNFSAALNAFRILNAVLMLEPLIQSIRDYSRRIILFGSYARGAFTSESDMDLFIVSDEREAVLDQLHSFLSNIDIDIRPVIKGQAEWIELEKTDPVFFSEVMNGLSLWEKQVDESGF